MKNKHTNFDDELEQYPGDISPMGAVMIAVVGMVVGWGIVELIFGADEVIYWVAGLITG